MEKIYELLDQLQGAIFTEYPGATNAGLSIHSDGYVAVYVEKVNYAEGVPVEKWKRRELLDRVKIDGEWCPDRSAGQNEYYKKIGKLLEEEA